MYSVNVSQVATVSFEGVISDIGSKDPLSFATVQLLHGDEVHSVLSKDNGVFSFLSVHPGDYILRITYVGYDRYEKRVTLKRDTKLTVKMVPSGNSLNASFPQLFYPLMTRQFFCDFHEKSEDFCVS